MDADDGQLCDTAAADPAETALLNAMRHYWGYESFRSLQKESMLLAMAGQDSLTVLPTGGGKSLCYQAPAVCQPGMAIVVSPLIALMKDQVDALTECGISAAFVNSSLTPQQRQDVAQRVRSGTLKLLFAAPERLVQPRTLDFLQRTPISFIAIDEAHCISNWGHDFRPEYRQLTVLREAFPETSIHAFTATATEKVRDDIVQQLGLKNSKVLVGNFDRPNLIYRVSRGDDRIEQILEVIRRHPGESGIVYCISRARVEKTAAALQARGCRVLPYHAGMDADQRRRHQEAFIEEDVDIIVATVAFGMGIDKSNVRFVVHAEMPSSLEAYQQESGRAGRDGLPSECCLFYSGRDVSTWEFLINQSENEDSRRTALQALAQMESFCYSPTCRHQQLVSHFGQQLKHDRCGACDVCLDETAMVADARVIGQKILSSVYRQGQRFGASYTVSVLRGSRARKVTENGHDKLSTWGLLKNETKGTVLDWVEQLIAQQFLRRAGNPPVLEITEQGGRLLRGELTPVLTRPKQLQVARSESDQWQGVDRDLFDRLRRLRARLAAERGVPPYIIFGDVTLRNLARERPTTDDELLQVHGIGDRKLQQFGRAFAEEIAAYCDEQGLSADCSEETT